MLQGGRPRLKIQYGSTSLVLKLLGMHCGGKGLEQLLCLVLVSLHTACVSALCNVGNNSHKADNSLGLCSAIECYVASMR